MGDTKGDRKGEMQKRVEGEEEEELIGKEKERTTYSEVIIGIPLIFKIVIKRYETHRT